MLVSIRNDDIDLSQQFLDSVHFTVNYRPRLSELELEFTFLSNFGFGEIRMTEWTPFCSVTNGFKFYLMKGAKNGDWWAAILGTNPEVIWMIDERIGIDAKIAEIGIQQHRSGIMSCAVMMFGVAVAWIALAAATSGSVEFREWSTENWFDVNSPIGFSQVTFELSLNADPAKIWFREACWGRKPCNRDR
jgi:hypothetical protein